MPDTALPTTGNPSHPENSSQLVPQQHTLAGNFTLEGVGLHSGDRVSCRLCPSDPGSGRYFVRIDLPQQPYIPASLSAAIPAQLSTLLKLGDVEVRTIEHLMGALAGLGVDNCRIELDGSEVPILDGSALPWVEAIASVGLIAQAAPRNMRAISQPLTVWDGEAFVSAIPSSVTRYTYGIDFPQSPIQQQWYSWEWSSDWFVTAIAPARTFTRQRDAEMALQQGLIKGGSLDNAIVCTATDWLNPLRFSEEPVRHKLIDLLGDLSLTGAIWMGHFVAYKAGHTLHGRFARELLARDGS